MKLIIIYYFDVFEMKKFIVMICTTRKEIVTIPKNIRNMILNVISSKTAFFVLCKPEHKQAFCFFFQQRLFTNI